MLRAVQVTSWRFGVFESVRPRRAVRGREAPDFGHAIHAHRVEKLRGVVKTMKCCVEVNIRSTFRKRKKGKSVRAIVFVTISTLVSHKKTKKQVLKLFLNEFERENKKNYTVALAASL